MFDVIDDVLLNYQKYSKNICTVKTLHKDQNCANGTTTAESGGGALSPVMDIGGDKSEEDMRIE